MGYRYKFTPLAASDLDETINYISGKLMNPRAANRLFRSVLKELDSVCDSPFAYPDCSYYLIDDKMIRHAIIGNYVLIFEVAEPEKLIKILRFLYGGMDISNMPIRER